MVIIILFSYYLELYHSEILKVPPPPKPPYHLTPVQTFGQSSVGIGAIVTGGNVKKSKGTSLIN